MPQPPESKERAVAAVALPAAAKLQACSAALVALLPAPCSTAPADLYRPPTVTARAVCAAAAARVLLSQIRGLVLQPVWQ